MMHGGKDRAPANGDRREEAFKALDEYGLKESSDSPSFLKLTKLDDREEAFNQNAQLMRELLMTSKENSMARDLIWKRLGETRIDNSPTLPKKARDTLVSSNMTPIPSRASSARKKNIIKQEPMSASKRTISKETNTGQGNMLQSRFNEGTITFGTIPTLESLQQPQEGQIKTSNAEAGRPTIGTEDHKKQPPANKVSRVSPTKVRPIHVEREESSKASKVKILGNTDSLIERPQSRRDSAHEQRNHLLSKKEGRSANVGSANQFGGLLQAKTDNQTVSPSFPSKEDFKRLQMRRLKLGRISSTLEDFSRNSCGNSTTGLKSPSKTSKPITDRRSDTYDFKSQNISPSRIAKSALSSNQKPENLVRSSSRSPSQPARSKSSTRKTSYHRIRLTHDCRNSPSICSPLVTPTGKQAKRIEFGQVSPSKASRQAEYDLNPVSHLLLTKSSTHTSQRSRPKPSEGQGNSTRSSSKLLNSRVTSASNWRPSMSSNMPVHQPRPAQTKTGPSQRQDHRSSTNVLLDLVLQKKLQTTEPGYHKSFLKSAQKDALMATAGASFFKQPRDSLTTEDSVRVLRVAPTPLDQVPLGWPGLHEKGFASQSTGTKDTKAVAKPTGERDSISLALEDQSLESMFQSVLLKSEACQSSLFT